MLAATPPGVTSSASHTSVNRTAKTDRLPARGPLDASRPIASVEVVGIDNVAVVYRDRQGQVLFRTDPVSNITVVAKGVTLPKVTVRDSDRTPAKQVPVERIRDRVAPKELPVGCESAVSVVADHELARIPSRCIS